MIFSNYEAHIYVCTFGFDSLLNFTLLDELLKFFHADVFSILSFYPHVISSLFPFTVMSFYNYVVYPYFILSLLVLSFCPFILLSLCHFIFTCFWCFGGVLSHLS
jgi:hypothetical protein